MQEMTMLTPYLLTEFHSFSVYLISGTRMQFGAFQGTRGGIQLKIKKGVPNPHGHPLIERNT
jgi:hypothetical protein